MNQVMGDLLPLAVGVAISPIPIIAIILMLLAPKAGGTSAGFLLGWVAGVVVATGLFTVLAATVGLGESGGQSAAASWTKCVLGVLLLLLGLRQWRSRPAPGQEAPLPCTPFGIVELLRRHGVELNGAEVVVVGRGVTVGRPLGLLLTRRSENATVTLCHTGTRDLAFHTRKADIIVAAAGVPGIITGDMVKPGAALLDVGVSRVEGKIAGDLAADVWDVAGWVSPNPGGVGPMTRAMLLSNIVLNAEKANA